MLTLSSTSNGSLLSGSQTSVNTGEAGTVKLVTMSLNGISGSGNLLTLYFTTAADCTPGTYPITVAIGNAYDTAFAPVTIGSVNGSVTVNRSVSTESFSLYGYPDKYTLQKDDVLSYLVASTSSKPFVSGEFTFTYDHELFSFDSVQFESALTGEGALYSVNSSVLGQVRIAYANDQPVSSYYLFTVKLKTIADTDTTTTVKAQATNMYREDLTGYLPGECATTLTLQKLPQVQDYPNAFLQTDRLVVGRQSKSSFCLEAGAGVAAADFTITYDPAILRCVSVGMSEGLGEKGGMVVINDNFSDGTIRFSYVNMDAYDDEDLPIVEIVWEPIQSPQVHYQVSVSSVGVVDAQQNAIQLEHITDTGCIYVATVKEPTCKTEGLITYQCACGETAPSEVLPIVPEDACTHYTVRFVNDDGTELSKQTCHYGDSVTAPDDPTKAADDTYTYTFAGWDQEVAPCTGDATYKATYTPTYIEYTVVFQNWDGTELSRKTYHWGDAVTEPETPTKAADKTYTYAFAGWDKEVVNCAGDATYKATYTPTYIEYTVVFQNWDGTELSRKTYHWGDTVTEPETPTKAADNTYTYTFAGWDKEVTACAGDATYKATYTPTYIEYTVVFQNWDGTELSRKTYHWGDTVTEPETPTKAADDTYTYAFAGWDKEVVNCAGDATYMATYTSTEIPAYICGDINGDGKVNNRDAARLMQYLAGWDVECVAVALDVNGDGKVNNRDAARLMQYLAGWDVELY